METRRTCFRNMRSKCQCSCVLQFTRHLRVSSVLHRPLSQMIHCIVLYLAFSDLASERFEKRTNFKLDIPTRGDHKLRPEKSRSHSRELADKLSTSPKLCYQPNTQVGLQELAEPRLSLSREVINFWTSQASIMILPQVHLRKPCYDFYFL